MAVEFDPKKNTSNLRKHGMPLTEGEGVLNDPLAITLEDTSSQGEQLWVRNWPRSQLGRVSMTLLFPLSCLIKGYMLRFT
ncbi:MAG: BrnT family toxin [Burkholderiales bacterium]